MPDFRDYEVKVPFPGAVEAQDMTAMGYFVDVYKRQGDGADRAALAPGRGAGGPL